MLDNDLVALVSEINVNWYSPPSSSLAAWSGVPVPPPHHHPEAASGSRPGVCALAATHGADVHRRPGLREHCSACLVLGSVPPSRRQHMSGFSLVRDPTTSE